MVKPAAPSPMKWVVPGRRAPIPRPAAAPPRRPPRLRLAVATAALAAGLAALVFVLSRSGDEPPPAPGLRPPAPPASLDGEVYESENVRIRFTTPPPQVSSDEGSP